MGKRYRDIVRQYSRAKRSARAVMMLLSDYADDDGIAWPGHERIAAECGLSERTVTRAIIELIEMGEIEIVTRPQYHSPSYYRILLSPKCAEQGRQNDYSSETQGRQNDYHRVDILTEQGRHPDTNRVDKLSDAYIEEPDQKEPDREPEAERETRAQAQPPPTLQPSPHPQVNVRDFYDPTKLHGDRIPDGHGDTPLEVYLEVFSRAEMRLKRVHFDPVIRDELSARIDDLDRWRGVLRAWKLSGYKPDNWQGMIDWYQDGIPKRGGYGYSAPLSKSDQTMQNFAEVRRMMNAGELR